MRAPAVEVVPNGPVRGVVRAPPSKSVTNRLLVLAALAEGTSALRSPLDSDDSAAMRSCVEALGAATAIEGGAWKVVGTGGAPRSLRAVLDARLSGTTARFVTAMATLGDTGSVITGHAPLRRRPIRPLVDALAALGGRLRDTDGGLPVHVDGGGLDGGAVSVEVSASSQFASALLMVAPYARHDVVCEVVGRSAQDYIELTTSAMAEWGARIARRDDGLWQVAAGSGYVARSVEVEYDASAAAHLFALAVATGGAVTVANTTPDSRQPDARVTEVLQQLGAAVVRDGRAVTVTANGSLHPIDVSLAAMPDQVTTLAVLAALAPGVSVLRDVGVARLHETDRLDALATELAKVGVQVQAAPDILTIHGGTVRGPASLSTYNDHRLAMAFAALGARVADIMVEDPGCVAKTYPQFWEDLASLGGRWEERQ